MKLKFEPFKTERVEITRDVTYLAPAMPVPPGSVLWMKDGSWHLVGTVNESRGVCDDCVGFSWEDVSEIAYIPLEGDLERLKPGWKPPGGYRRFRGGK